MNKKKILLIDDEAIILLSFSNELEQAGYDVTTAASGEEALARLKDGRFDLIITDLLMEGVDGIKVLQEAKKLDPTTGVFILTGYANITSAIEALRLGADDYLLKPCDLDELIMRMSHCFEKQALHRKVKFYENILPVCMYCKKIRDDTGTEPGKGKWLRMEEYLLLRSGNSVSHGCCPECFIKHMDD